MIMNLPNTIMVLLLQDNPPGCITDGQIVKQ